MPPEAAVRPALAVPTGSSPGGGQETVRMEIHGDMEIHKPGVYLGPGPPGPEQEEEEE